MEIPNYVQQLYAYFGIPTAEWSEHFVQDRGLRTGLRPEVAQVYSMLHRELRQAGRIK
jgi:hypothetical protein